MRTGLWAWGETPGDIPESNDAVDGMDSEDITWDMVKGSVKDKSKRNNKKLDFIQQNLFTQKDLSFTTTNKNSNEALEPYLESITIFATKWRSRLSDEVRRYKSK